MATVACGISVSTNLSRAYPRISMSSRKKFSDSISLDVSILKFIEKNWGLAPLSDRSRDNLPNPIQLGDDSYQPINGPAIGDLMTMFDFNN